MLWGLPSWPRFPCAKPTPHSPSASPSRSACAILTLRNVLHPTLHAQHPLLTASPQRHLLRAGASSDCPGRHALVPLTPQPWFSSGWGVAGGQADQRAPLPTWGRDDSASGRGREDQARSGRKATACCRRPHPARAHHRTQGSSAPTSHPPAPACGGSRAPSPPRPRWQLSRGAASWSKKSSHTHSESSWGVRRSARQLPGDKWARRARGRTLGASRPPATVSWGLRQLPVPPLPPGGEWRLRRWA